MSRSEREDGRDGFRLVADRVCERCNSPVAQFFAELVGIEEGVIDAELPETEAPIQA